MRTRFSGTAVSLSQHVHSSHDSHLLPLRLLIVDSGPFSSPLFVIDVVIPSPCFVIISPSHALYSRPSFLSLIASMTTKASTRQNMLVGLITSIPVSVAVEPTTATSTILLSAVYRLQLLPKFDCFSLYTCDTLLSVPTRTGFYTSKLSLQCSHTPGESEVILSSDWMSACSAALCDDALGLVDPPNPVVTLLPPGNYWSQNEGETWASCCATVCLSITDVPPPNDNLIDTALAFAKLHECLTTDSDAGTSSFLTAHGMDVEDSMLGQSDTITHLLNSYCANHVAPACAEISHNVRSPVEMAIAVTETVVDGHAHGQISSQHLSIVSGPLFP